MKILQTILTIFVSIFFTTSVLADATPAPKEEGYMFVINPNAQKVLEKKKALGQAWLALNSITYHELYFPHFFELFKSKENLEYWETEYRRVSESKVIEYINVLMFRLKLLYAMEEYYNSTQTIPGLNAQDLEKAKKDVKSLKQSDITNLMAYHNVLREYGKLTLEDRVYSGTKEDYQSIGKFVKVATLDKKFAEEIVLNMNGILDHMSNAGRVTETDLPLDKEYIKEIESSFAYALSEYGRDKTALIGSALALSLEDLYQKILDPNSIYFKASQKRAEIYQQRITFLENKVMFSWN